MLESAYEIEFRKIPFVNRKTSIASHKTLIVGSKFSGKSFLIYDFLSSFEKESYIYIDLRDSDMSIEYLNKNLLDFCIQKNIQTVVIEEYNEALTLPKVQNIILSSCENIDISGFDKLTLFNLDFEEFLAFDKGFDIVQSYNHFLQNGGICEMFLFPHIVKQRRLKEIVILLCSNETEHHILNLIATFISQEISIHRLYSTLKKQMKISKDSAYKSIENLKNRFVIYEIQKYKLPKSSKKFYLLDFALINTIIKRKDFFKTFENAIFLELIKKSIEVFYLNEIDFYIPSEKKAILSIPFCDTKHKKFSNKAFLDECEKNGITKVEIITVQSEFNMQVKNIYIDAIPFYTWAIGL